MTDSTAQTPHSKRGPGRPREFDLPQVLDQAVLVFREKGYNATSIGDLCQATGLTSGSLYKAFKDKLGIFLAALDHYLTARNAALTARMAQGQTGRDQLRAFISVYVDASQGREGRTGCMVISALTEITTFDERMALPVLKAYERLEATLLKIFDAGRADGSLTLTTDPRITARLLLYTLQGMRLAGKIGYAEGDPADPIDTLLQLFA
ncbi:TetR/AcrR family transcriptional regulator [Thioclava sp. GXIMD4215]|uniref:TetR/AcrR family transcriptional regulator n=1 Tax=Thioclava sp. GXIMD4215 TaxID=3131928 RepID=UPI00311AE776